MNNNITVNLIDRFGSPIGDTILIGDLISLFLSNAVFIAGFLIVFIVAIAGFGMIRSAGSGNPEQLQKGKNAVTAAIIGFIIIFSVYWIVQLIEAVTGIEILDPGI